MNNIYSYTSLPRGLSSTITLLRFPMAVVIILLHSSFEHEIINGYSIFEGWSAPWYHHLDYVFVQNVCNIAVPLFFFVSGFLFFKEGEFSLNLFKGKIKKRITTLLIPYMIWNIIMCLFYLVVQYLTPSMISGRNKLIMDYNVCDYVMMFWSMSFINESGLDGPIDGPLWFMRDLMVMMIISPVLFYLIKKIRILLPLFFLSLYIFGLGLGLSGFSPVALGFYTMGAFFAIFKFDFSLFPKSSKEFLLLLYFTLLVAVVIMNDYGIEISWLKNSLVVIGVFASIGWTAWLSENKGVKISPFLTSSTFFVYASHCVIIQFFIRLASRMGIQHDMYFCLMYFVCPLLTLIVILFIYKCFLKFLPSVAKVISGGR